MDVEFGTLLLSTQRAQQRALRQQQCTVVAANGRGKREHAAAPCGTKSGGKAIGGGRSTQCNGDNTVATRRIVGQHSKKHSKTSKIILDNL